MTFKACLKARIHCGSPRGQLRRTPTASAYILKRPLYFVFSKRARYEPASNWIFSRCPRTVKHFVSFQVRAELGGEYGEHFDEVNKHIVDLFTYQAVKSVLAQLQETDASSYRALYNFSVQHKPQKSYEYLTLLTKADPEIGRRVMSMREAIFEAYVKELSSGRADNIMADANVRVLKDLLNQSWMAQPGMATDADKQK
uniref:Uncharacterized protein n=1 Tax=Tetraselmis sp. GSL018 TaxID=582737 RepID=A0A061QUX6_9CHLO|mmetsp:Transcript_90/g.199  ORF Transcript_90/g.199 Transcript_90/m.199 type:complete len:199 (-) Transcript_90:310-906(-)